MSIGALKFQLVRILLLVFMLLSLATGCVRLRGGPPVVRGDRMHGVIVLPDAPSDTVREAAEILRHGIEQMTARTIEVVYERDTPANATVLALGPTAFADGMDVHGSYEDFEGDSYIIRSRGRIVVLAGNDEAGREGTIHAVYDLLERLGCGWYGSEPEWQVIPKVTDLRIPVLDVEERAAFDRRRIAVAGQLPRRAWRLGGDRQHAQTHEVSALAPRALREDHAEWFSAGRPDLCHPEVIAHIVAEFEKRLAGDERVHVLTAGRNDLHVWPDSEYRRSVGNPAAQVLYFANEIADRLRPEYEGRFAIHVFAGGYTHAPPVPPMQAAPEVFVKFANESNRTKPWDGSGLSEPADFLKNQAWIRRHFKGWLATGADLGIQEGWLPGNGGGEWREVPWLSMENTVRNARYWQRHGVREVAIDADGGQQERAFILWPQLYIGARALWNPRLDPEEELRKACDQLYGPAAESMVAYFNLLDRAMLETPYFHQNEEFPPLAKVYTPEIVAAAGEYLAAARVAAGNDENVAGRIAREAGQWQTAVEKIEASRDPSPVSYRAYVDDKFLHWPEPEATVGTIRRLFGIPGYIPMYVVKSGNGNDTADGETSIREAETIRVIELDGGSRLVTGAP